MRAAFFVITLLLAAPAAAQNFGNIPPQTVLGNPSTTAKQPAQPVPFTIFGGGAGTCTALGGDTNGTCAANQVTNLNHVTNGSLANSGLANSGVTLNTHALSLGGTLTLGFPDFAGQITASQMLALPLNNIYVGNASGQPVASATFPPGMIGTSVTAPHVPTFAALTAASTATYPNGVWRDDYSVGIGAPPLWYTPSGSACSLSAGGGDGGSQVRSADSKCWLAHFPTSGLDVRQFGPDPTGAADSASVLNACLAAASGKTCLAGGVMLQLSTLDIAIPANTTLKCGDGIPDQEDTPASYGGTTPRLMLGSAHSIFSSGQAAKVTGCLIVRNGMTFPAADSSLYAGIAVSDGGHSNLQLYNDVIIGFDTCANFTGARPWADTVYVDCAGVSNPAFWAHNGNTDSGYFHRIKIQPLGTGNWNGGPPAPGVSCAGATRPGVGFENNGINYFGDITINNFSNIGFHHAGGYMMINTLWTDFVPQCEGSYPTSIGVKNDGVMSIGELNLNGTGVGLVEDGYATIRHLFLNVIGGDCVVFPGAGILDIFKWESNAPGLVCGASGTGHAINYTSSDNHGALTIASGLMVGIASTPYINIEPNSPYYSLNVSAKLITDLPDPSSIFGANSFSTCSGVGTGNCTFKVTTLSTPYRGTILLNVVGTGSATGVVHLNMPGAISIGGAGGAGCLVGIHGDSGIWNTGATVQANGVQGGNPIIEEIDWSNNGVLLAGGKSYALTYRCEPQ